MSNQELAARVNELQELKRMQEELNAEIDALQDTIKAAMGDNEMIIAGAWKVTYKAVTSTRIDTAALKKDLPDVAARYSKTSTCKRFTIQ